MTDTRWTPGPWEACRNGECPCRMVWSKPYDMVVAVAIAASDEKYTCGEGIVDKDMLRANSLLIAAAPELYDAVLMLYTYCDHQPTLDAVNAVLKKARNEP